MADPRLGRGLRNGTLLAALVLGVVLFLNRHDLVHVSHVVTELPSALAVSILVHLPQILLTGLAWRCLIPRSVRPAIGTMALLRWMREAASSLFPAGALVGQAEAARLLGRHGVPGDIAGATATVDVTMEATSQLFFTLAGLLVLLAGGGGSGLAAVGGFLAVASAIAMIAFQRHLPARLLKALLTRLSRWLPALRPGWIDEFQAAILRLHTNWRALIQAMVCHSAAWVLGVVEVVGVLALLRHPVSFSDALIIESIGQALRNAGFLLPGAIGVQEGAIVGAAALVGVPPTVALTAALVRRTREVVVGMTGLPVWRRLERATARPSRGMLLLR